MDLSMNQSQAGNATEPCSFKCIFTQPERIAIIFSMGVLLLVSLIGNLLILYVTLKNAKMFSTTVLLVVNLSVADLLLTFFCIPWITLDIYLLDHWILGEIICKLVSYSQTVSLTASMLIISAISIQKLLVVHSPLSHRTWLSNMKKVTAALWILALLEGSPKFIYRQQVEHFGAKYCVEVWPNRQHRDAYSVGHAVVAFFIPSFIMILCSVMIQRKLRSRNAALYPNSYSLDSRRLSIAQIKVLKSRRRAVSLLRMVSFCCILGWTPYHVLLMVHVAGVEMNIRALNIAYPICIGLMFLCSALHPLLFGFMTRNYRRALYISFNVMTSRSATSQKQKVRNKSLIFRVLRFPWSEKGDKPNAQQQPATEQIFWI